MGLILQIVYSRLILYFACLFIYYYFQSTITFIVYYFYSSLDLFIYLSIYLLLLLFLLFYLLLLLLLIFLPLFSYNLELFHGKCLFKGAGANCRLCLKRAIGTPDIDVVPVSLLLALNVFCVHYGASAVDFEQVNCV